MASFPVNRPPPLGDALLLVSGNGTPLQHTAGRVQTSKKVASWFHVAPEHQECSSAPCHLMICHNPTGFCVSLQTWSFTHPYLGGHHVWNSFSTPQKKQGQTTSWLLRVPCIRKQNVCNRATDFYVSMGKISSPLCKKGMITLAEELQWYNSVFHREWRVFLQSRSCREMGKAPLWLMAPLRFFRQQCRHEKQEQWKPQLPASSSRSGQLGCYCWELLPSAVTQNTGKILIWQSQISKGPMVLVWNLYTSVACPFL